MVRKIKSAGSSTSQVDIIKRAKQMQEAMLNIQEGLKDKIIEHSVAGGQIVVKANGQKELVDIKISKEILEEAVSEKDASELENLILTAIKEVTAKADALAESEMETVTGGLKIPGLF